MTDIEKLRDEAMLGDPKAPADRPPATAAGEIAPFDDHAAYDETAARVGNERNIGVGDDPGLARGEDATHGRRPYIRDRDEIAPS